MPIVLPIVSIVSGSNEGHYAQICSAHWAPVVASDNLEGKRELWDPKEDSEPAARDPAPAGGQMLGPKMNKIRQRNKKSKENNEEKI